MICDKCIHREMCVFVNIAKSHYEKIKRFHDRYVGKYRNAVVPYNSEWYGVELTCKHYLEEVQNG